MLRDKDYVRTAGDLLFNVTGYEHPEDAVYASLKYVNGRKWTEGYEAACEFLSREFPEFVEDYIRVPLDAVREVYNPRVRWRQLLATAQDAPDTLAALPAKALRLANKLAEILQIPLEEFGITDSLLWSDGHAESDIDLIVVGLGNGRRILERGSSIYEADGFERPDPVRMTAPLGLEVPQWPRILSRRMQMGCFRGRLFSVRVVLTDEEIAAEATKVVSSDRSELHAIEFEVTDVTKSLLFPAIHRNATEDELVDYSVVYEGAFRVGDVVRCEATREVVKGKNGERVRWTMVGQCEWSSVE